MSIITGRKMKICVTLLVMVSVVGCGVSTEQSAEMQTTQIQDTGASYTKASDELPTEAEHIEDGTGSTQDMIEAEGTVETERTQKAQETGEKQYPILAEIPPDMYQNTDVDDKKSDNQHYRKLHITGETDGGAVVFVSEESYCIFDTASGTYGFLSVDGEVIAPFGYEEAYPFHEGTACVRVDDKFGYIGTDGEAVLPFIYDRATPFSEGLAYFVMGDTYGFMDESGEPVFYLDCESVSSFCEGRAYIYRDGKYGYIDRTGEVIIEPAYDDATYFHNGVAIVRKDGFYGVIGLDGEEILPAVYEEISTVDGTFLYGKKKETVQCFDLSGNKIIEGNYRRVNSFEGYFVFEEESGQMGMTDDKGNVIFEVLYDSIKKIPGQELAVVQTGEQGEIVDFSGETIVSFDCDWVGSVTESLVEISRDRQCGVIDLSGRTVVKTEYDDVMLYEDGTMLLKKDRKYTVRDESGRQILSNYEVVGRLGSGYEIKVYGEDEKSRYGIVDLDGNIVVQPIYFDLTPESPLIYGSENIAVYRRYEDIDYYDNIVRTAPIEEGSLSAEILVNEITPGSVFYQCANADTFLEEGFYDSTEQIDLQLLDAHMTKRRLYGNIGSGTHLYLSVESYDWLWYEDYYALLGEEEAKEEIPSVYGNYLGGGYKSGLWYDEQEHKLVQGRSWHYGGSGNLNGCEILEEKNGELVVTDSWVYSYDRYEVVTTYTINEKEATEEEYEAVLARYRRIEVLE